MQILPLVSVVIVNYNRKNDLREALNSIYKQDYKNIEIIVVDNASSDYSVEMLNNEFSNVRTIRLEENTGMDGYSLACRNSKGEFIFQMDNDSLMPDSNIISSIVKIFQTEPNNLAVIATRVEEYREGIHSIPELRKKTNQNGPINTFGYHAGGVGFRKALMDKTTYYNRDIFLYGAELFVQMQVLAAGFKISYHPEILMLHKSSQVARSGFGVYYEVRNRYWFMRYFGNFFQQIRYIPSMLLHDLVYGIHRRSINTTIKGIKDGFKKLPDSLNPHLHSKNPSFQKALHATGKSFSLATLSKRIINRLK